jgi:hypothetical protein
VDFLRGFAVLALGRPAAFLVVVAFLVAALGFSVFSVFFAAAAVFLGAALVAGAVFCGSVRDYEHKQ